MSCDVDIVLPWVDGNDAKWAQERAYWAEKEGLSTTADNSDERFRDWDTVRFVLRSIEKYLPWVRCVYFVTAGHIPSWLRVNSPKLKVVNHADFIPKDYLPTFSSHTIELNMHLIPGLADQFIYFNDDTLVMRPLKKEYFFRKGLPCDYAILNAMCSSLRYSVMDVALTDIEIINDHFPKNKTILHNFPKWFNPRYGSELIRTLLMLPWPYFSNLYSRHHPSPFLKETFYTVWEKEFEVLDSTSKHRFRTRRDVNQWLIRDWRLVSGDFSPISPKGNRYFRLKEDNTSAIDDMKTHCYNMVCLNDAGGIKFRDFEASKKQLLSYLSECFPEKSGFEL